MTNEEIRQTMQFILEQQAQSTANLQKLEETQLRDGPRLQRLEKAFVDLIDLARSSDERMDKADERLDKIDERLDRITHALADLTDHARTSDERLDKVDERLDRITHVLADLTRLIASPRNGDES